MGGQQRRDGPVTKMVAALPGDPSLFPASTLGISQLPVTLVPGIQCPFWPLRTPAHIQTQTCIQAHTETNKQTK